MATAPKKESAVIRKRRLAEAEKKQKEAMKKMLQHVKAVFTFGMRMGYCFSNPALNILAEDYYKFCNLTVRPNEERSFSNEELNKLREYCLNDKKNPHASMILVAMETGLRIGELAALKKSDIRNKDLS